MPCFVECSGDVKKCSRTILLVVKSFIYPLKYLMCLFYCGVPLPGTDLLAGYFKRMLFKRSFTKTLDTMGKRLIGWWYVSLASR
jgi:hypothetical protein